MKRQAYTNKLLVLGVDGMDPRISKRMMDDGRMPNLKKFREKGSTRDDMVLLGAIPTITPPCWTTLATGAYPGTHGITCYCVSLRTAWMLLYTIWIPDIVLQNRCGMLPPKPA